MPRFVYFLLFILTIGVLTAQRAAPFVVEAIQSQSIEDYLSTFAKNIGADAGSVWERVQVTGDAYSDLGHHRYRQTIQGIPVVASTIILHTRAGKVERSTGYAYTGKDADAIPRIDTRYAQHAALETSAVGKATVVSEQLVFVDRFFPQHSGILRLAYAVDLETTNPHNRWRAFVDAHSGEAFAQMPLIAHATVPGSGETTYYGNVRIDVDSIGPNRFLLQDDTRGVYVSSNEFNGSPSSPTSNFDFGDSDHGTMSVDVMYGAQRFYDLLEASFDWRGIDGIGEPMHAFVLDQDSDNFVNAYWDGFGATFGAGDCHFNPLTTLDVVGHEFAHGITERTSSLIYRGESGALNEGFSDIYGKALEYIEQPDQFSWTLGNRFADSRYARPFRSMEDPLIYGNPKVYQGTNWFASGGVHTNSGPLGHWFYLLVEGGSGTNELGTAYNVSPLSIEDAFRCAFVINRDYLTESSTYNDAYEAALLYAEATYGSGSAEYVSIVEAWKAIGLPASGPVGLPTDLAISSFSTDSPPTCHPQDGTYATVIIINQGQALPAGTEVLVTMDIDGTFGSQTVTFEEGFETGEFFYEQLVFPVVKPRGEYVARLTLDAPGDTQLSNNEATQDVTILNEPINIRLSEVEWGTFSCNEDSRTVILQIRNTGCEAIDENLDVIFYDESGTIIHEDQSRVYSMLSGFREWLYVNLAFELAKEVRTVEVRALNEFQLGDNLFETKSNIVSPLLPDQILDFENTNAEIDLVFDPFDSGAIGAIPYQNQHVFATTGGTFFGSNTPCLNPQDALNSDRSSIPPLTCLDMTGVADGVLEFDLIHLHGIPNPSFPELSDVSRALEVFWVTDSGDTDSKFISSQPDGERTKQTLSLPPDFVGQVGFNIYNATGGKYLYENNIDVELDRYDYTLIDNIGVRTSLSTNETNQPISIAPNPANAYVQISNPTGFRQNVTVISSLGVVLYEQEMNNQQLIFTENWAPGYYTVVVKSDDGSSLRYRLVVVH